MFNIRQLISCCRLMLMAAAVGLPSVATAQESPVELHQGGVTSSDERASRPDSIPVFERGIQQLKFIPKGQWIAGVSVSYAQEHADNYTFFVIENLNGDTYSFKVSPTVLYAFKDNLAIGGRFAYQRTRTQLDSGLLNLGEGTNFDVDHLYSIGHNFYVAGVFRNYLSIGSSMRFGFFNEVSLQLGGQSKLTNGVGDDFSGTYETNFSLSVGLQPGMVVFLNNYSAVEVNVGVLGFNYRHTNSTRDQIYESHHNSKSANFRINLFSIQFGATFYI